MSRYLNDDSVSLPVKARLSRVIESLGYKPSRTARNLSLGLKGCIGVAVDSIQDPWFTQLLTGMEEELQARDTSLMLLSLELRDRDHPAIAFEWIDERRVDGLIIAKCHRHDKALVQAAMDAQVPIVAVAPDETLRDVSVSGPTTLQRAGCWGHTLPSSAIRGSRSPVGHRLGRVPSSSARSARGAGEARYPDARRGRVLSRQLRGRGRRGVRGDVPQRPSGRRLSCSATMLWRLASFARLSSKGFESQTIFRWRDSMAFPKGRGRGRV